MKRRDVLKSIEVALVVKAYEVGHRSQRKDGVYEKQSDGSWVKIREQSASKSPKASKKPAPTKDFDSNEDREFDTLQKSITKMYDTGTLKDDISQIPADSSGSDPDEKEVREFVNGLLAMHDMSRSRFTTDHLDELEETITNLWHKNNEGSKPATKDYSSALGNQKALNEFVNELDFDPDVTLDQTNREDVEAYLDDHDWESRFVEYLEEQGVTTDDIDYDSEEWQNAVNDFTVKAVDHLMENWDFSEEESEEPNQDQDQYNMTVEEASSKVKELENQHPLPDLTDDEKRFWNAVLRYNLYWGLREKKDLGSAIEYTQDQVKWAKDGKDPEEKSAYDKFMKWSSGLLNKSVNKSYRDMRSAPTIKNMGF